MNKKIKKDPLDEIFTKKITIKELKDLKEEIELLKDGENKEMIKLRKEIKLYERRLKSQLITSKVLNEHCGKYIKEITNLKQDKISIAKASESLLELEEKVNRLLNENLECYPRYKLLELINY